MFSLSLYRSLQILNGAVTSDRSPVWSYNIPMGWRLKTRKHSSPRRKPIYLECLSFHSQRPLMRTNGYLPETDTLMTGTNRYTKLMTSTTQNSDLYYKLTPRRVCATHTLRHWWHIVQSHARSSTALPQLIDVINLMSVANVSMHAFMPKEDILAFHVTQEYTWLSLYVVNFVNNKAKWWYSVRYVRISLFLLLCFSQGSIATRCMCSGKYNTYLATNFSLSLVKELLKSLNISQSYEQISSGTFFMAHSVYSVYTY